MMLHVVRTMEVKRVIRGTIQKEQESERFSKIISVLAKGAFNMKGQELEQVLGVLIYDYLESIGEENPNVIVPQKKTGPDLAFGLPGHTPPEQDYDVSKSELEDFLAARRLSKAGVKEELIARLKKFDIHNGFVDLKFYGGSRRTQLSTLHGKDNLEKIVEHFQGQEVGPLGPTHKQWLVDLINQIDHDYTLSVYYNLQGGELTIDIFDFDDLDISGLIDSDWELGYYHADEHIEIHISSGDMYLEISTGKNAYNRGIWINKIGDSDDLDRLFDTLGIERVGNSIQMNDLPEVDSQSYVRAKGNGCLEFVDKLFQD